MAHDLFCSHADTDRCDCDLINEVRGHEAVALMSREDSARSEGYRIAAKELRDRAKEYIRDAELLQNTGHEDYSDIVLLNAIASELRRVAKKLE
jgi:hypothetical protein